MIDRTYVEDMLGATEFVLSQPAHQDNKLGTFDLAEQVDLYRSWLELCRIVETMAASDPYQAMSAGVCCEWCSVERTQPHEADCPWQHARTLCGPSSE